MTTTTTEDGDDDDDRRRGPEHRARSRRRLGGGFRLELQRVHRLLQLAIQELVHPSVSLHLTHPRERFADDFHLEVGLRGWVSASRVSDVPGVHGGLVDDVERRRGQSLGELLGDSVVDWTTDVHGCAGGFLARVAVGLDASCVR